MRPALQWQKAELLGSLTMDYWLWGHIQHGSGQVWEVWVTPWLSQIGPYIFFCSQTPVYPKTIRKYMGHPSIGEHCNFLESISALRHPPPTMLVFVWWPPLYLAVCWWLVVDLCLKTFMCWSLYLVNHGTFLKICKRIIQPKNLSVVSYNSTPYCRCKENTTKNKFKILDRVRSNLMTNY